MIRCLLVDDDALALLVLERYVGMDPELAIVGSCGTVAEARAALSANDVDLLLLDHDLPDETGLDLLRSGTPLPDTILITGARDLADEARAAGAVDTLVKPLSAPAFLEAVGRVHAKRALDPLP